MEICILSMQRVNNMGSLLQAYALKKMLEEMGHSVSFLDIQMNEADNALLGDIRLDFHSESERGGIIGKLSKLDRYTFIRVGNKEKLKKQRELFELFRQKVLDIEKKHNEYDVCVIGSDEVFNCLNAGDWGFTSQLFGNVPQAQKAITYAASCGATTYEKLPEGVTEKIRNTVTNLSAVSVRDDNTRLFIEHFTDKKISINLDPVLIGDFDREIREAELPKLPSRYCVIYSYINRIHDKQEIKAIQDFCNAHKLVPVALGAPQFWCKHFIPCSPFTCLKVFQNAEYIITDTFHGSILSVITKRKFATVIRGSNRNKLYDLLARLGLEDRVCNQLSELEKTLIAEIDYDNVQSILDREKRKTYSYLRESIVPRADSGRDNRL